LQHAPENEEATGLLETIRTAIKARERQRRLTEGLARAKEMLTSDRPEEAEALLSDLVVSYPAAQRIKELLAAAASAFEEKRRRRRLFESLTASRKLLAEKNGLTRRRRSRSWRRSFSTRRRSSRSWRTHKSNLNTSARQNTLNRSSAKQVRQTQRWI